MFHMLQRMTVWAKHFQIAYVIIFSVSVFMMHTKNFWLLCVPTAFTSGHQSSSHHVFAGSRKRRLPMLFSRLIDACFRAIFSFVRRGIQKFSVAVLTSVLNGAFVFLAFVVAFSRTIFCFIGSASDMSKYRRANLTDRCSLYSRCKPQTFAAAVQSCILTIRPNRK